MRGLATTPGGAAAGQPPRLGSAVGRFMLASLLAIAVVVVGGFFALRQVAIDEAERDTRSRVQAAGRLVEAAGLSDGVVSGDRAALRRLDDVVLGQVMTGAVVRVKLWSRSGRVLYSDEPALIGRRFALDADELRLFDTGAAAAELTEADRPENAYERAQGKLLEAHTPIRTPDGTQVLFEIYERFDSVSQSADRLLRTLAPPLIGGVLVLILFQAPLAWSMARRLQRGHSDREALLESAVAASSLERRRVAADLHDGPVQDLAGVAFGLAPIADAAQRRGADDEAQALREAATVARQAVRDLRALLVDLHPPNLAAGGLHVALSDLLSPLAGAGVETELTIVGAAAPDERADTLVYRTAREALRNVQVHAAATRVGVAVQREAGATRLVVRDDGRGFPRAERERAEAGGHLGLALLEGLVVQAGGTLEIDSAPGEGTTVTLEVPRR